MNKRKRAGEPFKDFPAPESDKDKESRELIYEAILLYRELKRIIPQSAQSVIRKVITASAVAQLNALIPRLKKKKINSMLNDELKQKLIKIVGHFPNAEWEVEKAEDGEFIFKIIKCRLVQLITGAGHPELSDAFCQGDKAYFDKYQKDIIFIRDLKIGSGDSYCDFRFKIK